MVTIPDRLFSLPAVTTHFRSTGLVMLSKVVDTPLFDRSSYLAMHALSIVAEGQQEIYSDGSPTVRIPAGSVGLMRQGIYRVTDLLAGPAGRFSTTLVFFDTATLRKALTHRALDVGGSAQQRTFAKRHSGVSAFAQTAGVHAWAESLRTLTAATTSNCSIDGAEQEFGQMLDRLVTEQPQAVEVLNGMTVSPKQPLREFMQAHFDKPLGLRDYALLTGRSERSFRRDFKTRFGESPKRWLVNCRLERAQQLLRKQGSSVSTVAAQVGYTSSSHFIEVYKRRYGITPGQLIK